MILSVGSQAIGLRGWQTNLYIVLPQALRTVVAPLGSIFIALIKNSALANLISVTELAGTAEDLINETAQPIHADDQLIPIAKPHVPTVCNSMWAITDFTEANGATRIIPGSHLADHSPDVVIEDNAITNAHRGQSCLMDRDRRHLCRSSRS